MKVGEHQCHGGGGVRLSLPQTALEGERIQLGKNIHPPGSKFPSALLDARTKRGSEGAYLLSPRESCLLLNPKFIKRCPCRTRSRIITLGTSRRQEAVTQKRSRLPLVGKVTGASTYRPRNDPVAPVLLRQVERLRSKFLSSRPLMLCLSFLLEIP